MNCSLDAKSQDKCRLKQLLSYSISGFVRATTVKIIIQTLLLHCLLLLKCSSISIRNIEEIRNDQTIPRTNNMIQVGRDFLFCFDLFLSYQTSLYQIVQEDACDGKEIDLNKCRLRWILQAIDNFAR